MPGSRSFVVKSIHSYNRIEEKIRPELFGVLPHFFIFSGLETFDGIIGLT